MRSRLGQSLVGCKDEIKALKTTSATSWEGVLAESRILELERDLASFLLSESRSVTLVRQHCDRMLAAIERQRETYGLALQNVDRSTSELLEKHNDIQEKRTRLEGLVKEIREGFQAEQARLRDSLDSAFGQSFESELLAGVDRVINQAPVKAWKATIGPQMEIELGRRVARVTDELNQRVMNLVTDILTRRAMFYAELDEAAGAPMRQIGAIPVAEYVVRAPFLSGVTISRRVGARERLP